MARKKVVLFIVEGISDKDSLEILLDELLEENNEVIFQVVGGDITADRDIKKSNIKNGITNIIKDSGKRKFKPSDYREVIHLVDMDAAFISEENIYEDITLDKFIYKDDGIYANKINRIIERNNRKQGLLNLLTSTNKVYGSVPYRVFYFSCNLEHVLHNERIVEKNLKVEYANKFQDKYIDDLDAFINLICNSEFSVKKEYKESWEFIKQDNNSIKRFTNFNILIEDYLSR